MKRNKTAEGCYRNSVVSTRPSNPQDKESGHKKSKNSEHDDRMSVGTQRGNS